MRIISIFAALLLPMLAGSAVAQHGLAPPSEPPQHSVRLQDRPPIVTLPLPDNAADAVVVIFNHGTNRPQYRHACNEDRDVPGVLRDLASAQGWRVHYLCSLVTDDNEPGSYTYKRADEILAVAAAYRVKGVPARHIFLFGHSAGGWSSLMAARKDGTVFNAIVAFAPAFAGPRHEEAQFPIWRQQYAPQQIAYLRQAKRIDALILAYSDDIYDRPQDLAPLESIPGVRLVAFDACNAGHGTTYTECFRSGARVEIEDYMKERLAQH